MTVRLINNPKKAQAIAELRFSNLSPNSQKRIENKDEWITNCKNDILEYDGAYQWELDQLAGKDVAL